jgi:hypothetical protein
MNSSDSAPMFVLRLILWSFDAFEFIVQPILNLDGNAGGGNLFAEAGFPVCSH